MPWCWVAHLEDTGSQHPSPSYVPSFLKCQLQQIGWQRTDLVSRAPSSRLPLQGLLFVELGALYHDNVSAGWSEETHFLQERMLSCALDAYAIRVKHANLIEEWEEKPHVLKRARRPHFWNYQRTDGIAMEPTNLHGQRVFHIAEWCLGDCVNNTVLEAGVGSLSTKQTNSTDLIPIAEALRLTGEQLSLRDLPVVLLPEMIAKLVFQDRWHSLVLLARWTHPNVPSLLPDMPAEWLEERLGKNGELPSPRPLDAVDLETTVAVFRRAVNGEVCLPEDFSSCVATLQGHLNSLNPPPSAARKLKDLPDMFLRQILASMDLRSRGCLKRHGVKFIECLPEGMRPSMQAWVERNFAGSSSLKDGQLYLDIALLLFHRQQMQSQGQVYMYAWGDSSKKGHLDMYNTRHRWFPKSMSIELARAFRWLCANQAVWADEESANPQEDELEDERCNCSQFLFDNIHLRTQIPQLLGQGRAKLIDKVSAHVHSSLLELGSVDSLSAALGNCVTWCSDMGTESGLPSCHVTSPEEVLPAFVRPCRLQTELEAEDGCVQLSLAQSSAENAADANATELMPNAIHIPGMCHAIHNSSANLDTSFTHFAAFLEDLKCVHKF